MSGPSIVYGTPFPSPQRNESVDQITKDVEKRVDRLKNKKPYTLLVKQEITEKVSYMECDSWEELIRKLDSLQPMTRVSMVDDSDEETVPGKLVIVILENKHLGYKPDYFDVTVGADIKDEF